MGRVCEGGDVFPPHPSPTGRRAGDEGGAPLPQALGFAKTGKNASLPMFDHADRWLPLTPSPSPAGEGNA